MSAVLWGVRNLSKARSIVSDYFWEIAESYVYLWREKLFIRGESEQKRKENSSSGDDYYTCEREMMMV